MSNKKSRGDSPTPRLIRYRDSKTGHFVSKATWNRSKAHGGTRYKRTTFEAPKLHKPRKPKAPPKPPEKPQPPPKPPYKSRAGEKLSWLELNELANTKDKISVYFNDEIRTPGQVDIAGWAENRPAMRDELTDEFDDQDGYWKLIPVWKIDVDTIDTIHAHAQVPE